ncbi:MAG: M1 family metallopeptidase [Planctomycetota bacterium]|nr:M1 family metallopeptidase [Planctomycetota bacterium]
MSYARIALVEACTSAHHERMPLSGFARDVACLLVASAIFSARPTSAQSGDERSCRTDYVIAVRYDENARTLTGTETITWRNESRDDVPDLWFHLYWNAFANDATTHHLGTGRPGSDFKDGEWGWTRITSLVVDGKELAPSIEFVSPDDKRSEDRTVCRVKLPAVAKRGDVVTAKLAWEAQIPRLRRRTGYKDDFLLIAQWFPKLGVYESGNGWNCHQFHRNTEFFSDYGTYDVELDLPARYESSIGASGVLAEPTRAGNGRVKARFAAPSEKDRVSRDRTGKSPLVHDFTWVGDPTSLEYEGTFHYDEWAQKYRDEVDRVALALGRAPSEMRLRDVRVTVLLQPEHYDQGQRHFDATCTALFFYGLWFGEYPYEHVTCVDPAWGGRAAGGMEYPTLFTAGTRPNTIQAMHEPESVIVHECGHQFWYGLVGNNEFEAAWLDEGFNTFTQNEALWLHYGARISTTDFAGRPFDGVPITSGPGGGFVGDALSGKRWKIKSNLTLEPLRSSPFVDWWRDQPMLSYGRLRTDPRETDRSGYLSDPDTDPVDRAAFTYCDRNSYRTNSYRRTATALRSLQGLVGEDKFLRGMRHYAETWRYRHPYPQDFFDAFQEGSKVEIAWYFEQAFRSTATLDWRVEVDQKSARDPRGLVVDASGAWVERALLKKPDVDEADDDTRNDEKDSRWDVEIIVRRKGALLLPLTIELTWAGGEKEQLTWGRDEQARSTWWKPLEGRKNSTKKLVSAVIDPERRYSFDTNMSNNQWYDAVDSITPLRWSERVFEQYASLMHWWGGIGG